MHEECAYTYRNAVKCGEVYLRPRNIDGTFCLDARSHIAERIIFSGEYEPEVTNMLERLAAPGGLVVNIGANVGLMSVFLANHFPSRKVMAIEPNPDCYRMLIQNIKINNLQSRIEAAQCCISNRSGSVSFSVIEGLPEYSSIGGIVHPAVIGKVAQTMQVRVDQLVNVVQGQRVGFVFADTEGAEAMVFEGAKDILARDRPVVLCECSDLLLKKFGSTSRELEELFKSQKYKVSDALLARNKKILHPFEGELLAFPEELA
jgi:FkbM family methyltransferase